MFKVYGVARVAGDVVLKPVGNNKMVEVSVAQNDARGNGHFFTIQLWDSGAEAFAQHIAKGDLVSLEGELRHERWTNKEGEAKQKQIIRVTHFIKAVPSKKEVENAGE